MKNTLLAVLFSIAILASGCATAHHTNACDYKVVHASWPAGLEGEIQRAAADGWMVVSSGGAGDNLFAVMSKPK